MKVLVTQLCLTLQLHGLCSLPDSTVLKFSRQEYWSGLPCPLLGDLLDPGIKPRSLALQANSLQFEVTGKPRRPKSKLFCLLCLSLKNSLMSKILFAKNILTFFSVIFFWTYKQNSHDIINWFWKFSPRKIVFYNDHFEGISQQFDGQDSTFSSQRLWVQSVAGEQRSCKLCWIASPPK